MNIYYFRFNIFKKGTFNGLFEKRAHCQKTLEGADASFLQNTSERLLLEETYKVSFADFWSSVDLPHLDKLVDSHELYKVTTFINIITNKLDRLQKIEKYQ